MKVILEIRLRKYFFLSPLDPDINKMKIQKRVAKSSLGKYLIFKEGERTSKVSQIQGSNFTFATIGCVSLGRYFTSLCLSLLGCETKIIITSSLNYCSL